MHLLRSADLRGVGGATRGLVVSHRPPARGGDDGVRPVVLDQLTAHAARWDDPAFGCLLMCVRMCKCNDRLDPALSRR